MNGGVFLFKLYPSSTRGFKFLNCFLEHMTTRQCEKLIRVSVVMWIRLSWCIYKRDNTCEAEYWRGLAQYAHGEAQLFCGEL